MFPCDAQARPTYTYLRLARRRGPVLVDSARLRSLACANGGNQPYTTAALPPPPLVHSWGMQVARALLSRVHSPEQPRAYKKVRSARGGCGASTLRSCGRPLSTIAARPSVVRPRPRPKASSCCAIRHASWRLSPGYLPQNAGSISASAHAKQLAAIIPSKRPQVPHMLSAAQGL